MFDMQLPWWEVVVRTAIVYACLLVLVRLSGKRTVGQFTPFDLLVVMLLSESVTESLTGGDKSLIGGLIAAATLIALNVALASLSARSRKVDQLSQGSAVVIGRDGKLDSEVLKRERVPEEDVHRALRAQGCELADMRKAYLESDGEISIFKRES